MCSHVLHTTDCRQGGVSIVPGREIWPFKPGPSLHTGAVGRWTVGIVVVSLVNNSLGTVLGAVA